MALALFAGASAASAQVTVQLFSTYGAEPTLGGPFNGAATPFCTTTTPSISFASAAAFHAFVTANCPGAPASFDGYDFGARLTGTFVPSAAGAVDFDGSTDDGFSLFVNGVQEYDRWFDQSGGIGVASITLNAGANPFQLDYYANGAGVSFLTLAVPQGVRIGVTAVPEPGTYLLLASGLLAIGAVARRKGGRG